MRNLITTRIENEQKMVLVMTYLPHANIVSLSVQKWI